MSDYVNDDVINRIQNIYKTATTSEQQLLRQILEEISIHGDSQTYRDIWLADFKEVPVTIDQFICDPRYLGETNRNGEAVYPYWRNMLRDLFADTNKYNAIVLTGSTRVGKTSTSIVIAAYMLYRLMLYRNPHQYFQKKEVSRFTLAFANLTKELALSVAYREFNDTLRDSKWFMDHGRVSASDRNFYYIPEGDKIEIIPASDAAMLLGKQLWCCLSGDTRILTADGSKSIESCAGTYQDVLQLTESGFIYTTAFVTKTKEVQTLIEIELVDGSLLRGTPDHLVMLSDGSYKALGDLSNSDDLLTFNI